MPFENGRISFRIFSLSKDLPSDYIDRFARHCAPPIESCSGGNTSGWVTGRHMLDRDIREETAHYAGYLRMALLEIEKKIPPSLLKAECQMEELAVMEAEGRPFLNRKERSDIRKEVYERLLPEMPPQMKEIPFIHMPGSKTLYASALSIGKCDLICSRFLSTMGYNITPCAPDRLIELLGTADYRGWRGASFSPRIDDEAFEADPGSEFMTWLLYIYDACEACVEHPELGRIEIMIEGPLRFYHEGKGVHETMLKSGEPIRSPEATISLMSGKKLKQAKLTLAVNGDPWEFALDSDAFVFRNMLLPEADKDLDYASRFDERIRRLDQFRDIFFGLYGHFLKIRDNVESWKSEKGAMRAWVSKRAGVK